MPNVLHRSIPVVDDQGRPLQNLQLFSEEIESMSLIIGIGSPEGIYRARVGREYLDTTGGIGAVKYIKQLAEIGGDDKLGWKPI